MGVDTGMESVNLEIGSCAAGVWITFRFGVHDTNRDFNGKSLFIPKSRVEPFAAALMSVLKDTEKPCSEEERFGTTEEKMERHERALQKIYQAFSSDFINDKAEADYMRDCALAALENRDGA